LINNFSSFENIWGPHGHDAAEQMQLLVHNVFFTSTKQRHCLLLPTSREESRRIWNFHGAWITRVFRDIDEQSYSTVFSTGLFPSNVLPEA